ncbi:MAG: response regulator transcription factor [Chloroflexota bacterium]
MKLLMINNEPRESRAIVAWFEACWPEMEVMTVEDSRTGIAVVGNQVSDIVVMVDGPLDMDGLGVCREIRRRSGVPTIVLADGGREAEKMLWLEAGADAYITRPYSYIGLLARVAAALRWSQAALPVTSGPPCVVGPLYVDFATRELLRRGQRVTLTPIEYRLLYHLVKNRGRVLPHRMLLAKVWGREYAGDTELLKVYIQHLRRKVEDDPKRPRMVLSERGIGYMFVEPAPALAPASD